MSSEENDVSSALVSDFREARGLTAGFLQSVASDSVLEIQAAMNLHFNDSDKLHCTSQVSQQLITERLTGTIVLFKFDHSLSVNVPLRFVLIIWWNTSVFIPAL